jgi:hypothetical protein
MPKALQIDRIRSPALVKCPEKIQPGVIANSCGKSIVALTIELDC